MTLNECERCEHEHEHESEYEQAKNEIQYKRDFLERMAIKKYVLRIPSYRLFQIFYHIFSLSKYLLIFYMLNIRGRIPDGCLSLYTGDFLNREMVICLTMCANSRRVFILNEVRHDFNSTRVDCFSHLVEFRPK